jgi:hypothetical protein
MHRNGEIGFISFHNLKPYFMKNLQDFNSCYCKYHQEMVEIKVGFNNMHALQFIMARKTPSTSVGASHFVQIPSMETLGWQLLLVKPPPTHLQRFLTYGRRPYAPKFQAINGLIWSVLGVIVQNVAFVFYHFVIGRFHGILYTKRSHNLTIFIATHFLCAFSNIWRRFCDIIVQLKMDNILNSHYVVKLMHI